MISLLLIRFRVLLHQIQIKGRQKFNLPERILHTMCTSCDEGQRFPCKSHGLVGCVWAGGCACVARTGPVSKWPALHLHCHLGSIMPKDQVQKHSWWPASLINSGENWDFQAILQRHRFRVKKGWALNHYVFPPLVSMNEHLQSKAKWPVSQPEHRLGRRREEAKHCLWACWHGIGRGEQPPAFWERPAD